MTPDPTGPMRALLARQRRVILATHDPDGAVHLAPLAYLFDGRRFLTATPAGSRKVRNLVARPEVTVLVEDRDATAWVAATGHAEIVDGAEGRALRDSVYRLWLTDDGVEVIGDWMSDDVTVAVTPRRWRAWDFETGFLDGLRASSGVPMDDPARWFRP
jgi:PPOX class probable F420-dependent enzyme